MLLQITYHDKATQTETEEEDRIEKILKAITTHCTEVDSMDNEIQKLPKISEFLETTQTETEEEDRIEKILKAITTHCTKVDSMDNEIQKLKTDEDNLKSKDSQQHDYKNAELR
ncbi:hypothetical protein MTR67_043688 [Solanum verrucosum]|uniref:Uncharacterized protein n=1 Tax=Solanum verrucosum TaxID=315347 RepID=A0AAF0UP71_SOLVR|nr:hypothetical protein MTR67_043669 [Solanum verrucosum]WMV50303.1 hypothetical protein MTR67_043688 [Solanum verrucosum]